MPFKHIIRRRLLSLLRPWLLEEPEFDLKLGFIRSFAGVDHLRIDVSVLNELFDAPALLFFKDITIEHLSIGFSNWSAPAFSIEVHGVHVVLSFEKPKQEGCLGRLRKSKHDDYENVRKKLSALDPEGCTLHHLLERILFAAPSKKDFSTSLVNLILKHCHLEVHHIRVEIQFPILNNVLMCFGELEELNARSKFLDVRCITRGLLSAIFLPVNESSYILNGIGLKIGFNERDCADHVLLSSDVCTYIKLHDLQLADCTIYFPELTFSFSPDDIFIYLALDKLLSNKYNHARSARELWRLAASRMGYTVIPRLTFHRLVHVVSQWIHYVNAYESLLLLIGYSSGILLNRSFSKISWNNHILSSAKHHWKVISDIEERLPIEGIALARQVARHRAALKVQSDGEKRLITSPFNFFRPVLPIMALIWKVISKIIQSLANLIFLRKEIVKDPYTDVGLESATKSPCQKCCFILNIGKLVIMLSQPNRIQPSVYAKLQSHTGIEYMDFHSISFCIDALLFVSVEDIFEQRVFVSCGLMKVMLASLEASSKSSKMNMLSDSEKKNRKEGINDMESILWVGPAKLFSLSDINDAQVEGSCDFRMENFLGKICLSWKGICDSFIENEMEYSENPSLLCKFERSFTYPGLENPGITECGLILGKLDLVLTHYSVSSVSLLLSQMQHFIWREDKGKTSIVPNCLDKQEGCCVNKFEYYAKAWIMTLLQVLPEKNIQLGVFVDGPSVRFLHNKKANPGCQEINDIVSHDGFDLIFDFHEIKVAIGSPSLCGVAPLLDLPGFDDAQAECLRLEPRAIEIPKPNSDKYASWGRISFGCYLRLNGLNACLRKPAEGHQFQLFVMKPIALQISSIREHMYSLSTRTVAFSAAFGIMAGGLTVLSFLDELYMIYQAVASLYAVVSCLFSSLEAVDTIHPKIMKEEALFSQLKRVEGSIGRTQLTNYGCLFLINGNCRLKSVDVILHNSRTKDNVDSWMRTFNFVSGNILTEKKFPDYGIWVSLQHTTLAISCEEGKADILTDSSRIMLLVFENLNSVGNNDNYVVLENLGLQSDKCLREISLSDCKFTLYFGSPQKASSDNESEKISISSPGSNISLGQDTDQATCSERSNNQSLCFVKERVSAARIPIPASGSHWLLMSVTVGNVFIGSCQMRNDLVQAHQLNKFMSSLSIGGEFELKFLEIQGGLILETTSLAVVTDCYSSYLHCILSLASAARQHSRCTVAEHGETSYNLPAKDAQGTLCASHQAKSGSSNTFALSLSHFALVFVHENESGEIRELVVEVDIHLKLESATTMKKLTFDLSHLSILSQVLHTSEQDETVIPHFSSVTSEVLSSHHASGVSGSQNSGELNSVSDASSSRDSVPLKKSYNYRSASGVFHSSHQNPILKDLRASVSLERPENGSIHLSQSWFGNCSLPDFDITLSLSEIQTILSMTSSFYGMSSQKTSRELNRNNGTARQEFYNNLEALVPDGAIVAIQDVAQHMYLTVKGEERNLSIGGTIHYSLEGERALFRVKYCIERRWKSMVLWFSLISLYAKNDMGMPLRLNYSPGSCFVDISCTNDGGCALWRAYPLQGEGSEGVTEWEGHNQLVNKTFYLVNKKNDSGVAFLDGVPEYVQKPGSPFKFKVFHELSVALNGMEADNYPRMASLSSLHINEESFAWLNGKPPQIDVKVGKISVNFVHELPDTEDLFPLIRACINNAQLIIQSFATKSRIISTSRAVVHYFDAQRNIWGELLRPVEICLFYRTKFQSQQSEYASYAVPVNLYCRAKELNICLCEISLDVLLFMIGKLNLSGPYSLRSSMVLANYCKVENQSGLNLLFHFNQQRVTIARKQSTSILVRRLSDFTAQDLDNAASVSIQLADSGSLVTSSIHLSLSQSSLAWRTRIMSMEGSRSYPGPLLVVNISRKLEDGLSVVVSPLVTIRNETGLSMELQFQRPQPKEDEFASVSLKPGDSIDDSMAIFDAIKFSGGVKRALMSLTIGNFLFSLRPEMTDDMTNSESSLSVGWSDCIKGGKAVRLSGIFDKLNYKVRKALFVKSVKCSFSTAHCALKSEGVDVGNMHFLIQTIARDVPVAPPEKSSAVFKNKNSPVSLQEQKEIYILPTIRMTNLLHSEIDVLLSETDQPNLHGTDNIGKQAKISCGTTVDFYANPAVIYFTIALTATNSSSKPVNSGDCVKRLLKQNGDAQYLDIILDFDGGKFFAALRLYRGNRGMLEAVVFTSYAMKNETDFPIYVFPTKKHLSRIELDNLNSSSPWEFGLFLPPKSTRSWFLKSKKVQLRLLEDYKSEALLDLDSLSGLAEIRFYKEEGSEIKSIIKLGVSTGPSSGEIVVPSQTVTLVPRYVICNESEECITVRQCYFQDDLAGIASIDSKQQTTLQLKEGFGRDREFSLFDHFIRKHRSSSDKSWLYVQIKTKDPGFGWSGPVCIASLGRFFLKFRKITNNLTTPDRDMTQFAAIHVVEEGSTLVLHFYKSPNLSLPYRIENCLHNLSITYYQKGSSEPEVLGSATSADYVWDDLTLPHRLVVRINDSLQLREIKLDKVRSWKPFYKAGQQRALAPRLLLDQKRDQSASFGGLNGMEMENIGYEIYAEGPTRVLRICEISDSFKRDTVLDLCAKMHFRISQFAIHLLEPAKQEVDENHPTDFSPFLVAKLGNLNLSTVSNNHQKYNQFSIQYLNLELKWNEAPFASMLRKHQSDYSDSNDSVLKVVFVQLTSSSKIKQFRYSSIFLQPIDLNLDEETLMKLASFWRRSLSNSESQRFYFDHFEIHPIKITASFIPGDSHSCYSSAQETLRSFLHSVIKVPPMKGMVVELNGVLISHALITVRELIIKCAQHYSWYAMRAMYIAKGSPLLPPDFVSIFDDLASSSLDVFFDPSRGLMNLPGLTLGTFKFISKCIKNEGFSGTRRYFGDLGKTLRSAGSNVVFTAVAEISDSVLKGAEATGFNGMVSGFHQGILKLAMEPSFLGTALMEGGPDRKIILDQSPGVDELYIEGYIQAMLDTVYRQEYLRVRVIDNQVILKNLPPNHSLINEIMDRVKEFLVNKALIKGDPSTTSRPLRRLRGKSEWKIGPTLMTLFEHLFVSFAIRMLRGQANKFISSLNLKWAKKSQSDNEAPNSPSLIVKKQNMRFIQKWGITKFVLSGILAYIDGRLCRCIPNPVARRVVSGFLLSYIDQNDNK